MIFVTLGTNEAKFDRLLEAVAACRPDEEVVIQHGHSTPIHPPGATVVPFLSFDEMVERIRAARAVVTHAGVGTILVALGEGKRPIVLPRRGGLGEAVDDHQLQLGRRFAKARLVTLVETPEELEQALRGTQTAPPVSREAGALASELRSFFGEIVSPAGSAS